MDDFKQTLQVVCMISDFAICTVYFSITNKSCPTFHINTTCVEQGKKLRIDFTECFGHVTCMHCDRVDLPNLKEE